MGRYKSGIRRVTGGQKGQKRGTRRQHEKRIIDQQRVKHAPTVTTIPTRPKSILDPRISYGHVDLPAKPHKATQMPKPHHKFPLANRLGNQLGKRIDKICIACGNIMHDVWPNRQRCIPCATTRTHTLTAKRILEYRSDPTYVAKENEAERERHYTRYHTDDAWRLKMCAAARARHHAKKALEVRSQ